MPDVDAEAARSLLLLTGTVTPPLELLPQVSQHTPAAFRPIQPAKTPAAHRQVAQAAAPPPPPAAPMVAYPPTRILAPAPTRPTPAVAAPVAAPVATVPARVPVAQARRRPSWVPASKDRTLQIYAKAIERLVELGFRSDHMRAAKYPELICHCVEQAEKNHPAHFAKNPRSNYKLEPHPTLQQMAVCGPRVLCPGCGDPYALRADRKIRRHPCEYYRMRRDITRANAVAETAAQVESAAQPPMLVFPVQGA